ncbi:uncharacterized protein LOC141902252 [Tubulanus polymorphus]|uniref:uncharacterized protein LOC141902252 n=1 Tax=Tubulanus polymorphus TaxID=672921 RepID=UPI003DA5CF37
MSKASESPIVAARGKNRDAADDKKRKFENSRKEKEEERFKKCQKFDELISNFVHTTSYMKNVVKPASIGNRNALESLRRSVNVAQNFLDQCITQQAIIAADDLKNDVDEIMAAI